MPKPDFTGWSKEDLTKEVQKLRKRKKYGIVWDEEHTKEQFEKDSEGKLPVLLEVKGREVTSSNNKAPNILIEGDNYHALAVLNYTHIGTIDVIYIDPPYNTGNEDFIYNDNYVDPEDPYRHSKWLSFMGRRLRLAKNLLKDSGTIFISIDDNELAQLKLLCDEVFGEDNFIITIAIKRSSAAGHKTINPTPVNVTEYVLVYTKNRSSWVYEPQYVECEYDEMYSLFIENIDKPHEKWRIRKLAEVVSEKLGFENSKEAVKKLRSGFKEEIAGFALKNARSVFRFTAINYDGVGKEIQKLYDLSKKNPAKIYHLPRRDRTDIYIKDRNRMTFYYPTKVKEINGRLAPTELLTNLWADIGWHGIAGEGGVTFNKGKKPLKLIKRIIKMATANKGAVILDFFAGSGTTGEAVLEMNSEDRGNRLYILCTNNENNICTEVCYPRIRKALSQHKGNLRYFKTNFVESEATDRNKKKLVDQSTEMLCLKEYCFDEVSSGKHFKLFKNAEGRHLGIIYDDDGIEPFKKEIKKLGVKASVYVFSLDDSAREEEFEDIADLVELKPIPQVILNVYRRLFK